MFSISFYAANGEPSNSIRIPEAIYEWLAKSEFSKIGSSTDTPIHIDEEDIVLPLVELTKEIRQKLINFFRDSIIRESDAVLAKLGDSPSKEEYREETYRLKKLHELLKCLENENYDYLQRV